MQTTGSEVFIDFSKAFHLVEYNILLTKLHRYNVQSMLFEWCIDCLTRRQQEDLVTGEASA